MLSADGVGGAAAASRVAARRSEEKRAAARSEAGDVEGQGGRGQGSLEEVAAADADLALPALPRSRDRRAPIKETSGTGPASAPGPLPRREGSQ